MGRDRSMKFRLKAFALHLLGSACLISLVLGGLYLGWYRWPGWYLAGALHVVLIMAGVDVALGPLLTMVVANPRKPRRELARDIGLIVAVQIIALGYGTTTLWHGRPLYYTFSVNRLEMVQASDLDESEIALALKQNPEFAPHWYSRPRWIWAPLPDDPSEQDKIVTGSIGGGDDVIQMPRYFKPWSEGLPELRKQLKVVDSIGDFSRNEKKSLKRTLTQQGLATDQPVNLVMTGRTHSLLAVFDSADLHIKVLLRAE